MSAMNLGLRLAAVALVAAAGATAGAQGVIIGGSSSARYVDLHPTAIDSVPLAATQDAGNGLRITADGIYVKCNANDFCRYNRSLDATNVIALMQDIEVTAWGLGQGVSAHAQLRMRSAAGGGREIWPQAQETFDALAAYVEIDRDRWSGKLGRQWLTSGFGFSNFDGASVSWRALTPLTLEAYGGWSLVEGLARPVTDEAISAVEDIPPTERAYLLGAALRIRPMQRAGMRLQYQREIRTDRAALYSERAALDGDIRLGLGTLTGAAAYDLATNTYNEARLRYQRPIVGNLDVALQARHYEPFFALWTIWGMFDPVGYDEGRAEVRWADGRGRVSLGVNGGKRSYQRTETGFGPAPLRTDGWRLGAHATVRPLDVLAVDGSYGLDAGNGASRSDADVAVRWEPNDRFAVGLRGTAFQTILEYEVGGSTVLGGGFDMGMRLWPGVRLAADAMLYRQTRIDQPQYANWNQRRGGIRLEWTLGRDPGADFVSGTKP